MRIAFIRDTTTPNTYDSRGHKGALFVITRPTEGVGNVSMGFINLTGDPKTTTVDLAGDQNITGLDIAEIAKFVGIE